MVLILHLCSGFFCSCDNGENGNCFGDFDAVCIFQGFWVATMVLFLERKKCGDVDCAADDDDDGNNFAPGILWCHYLCYLIR